MNKEEQKIEKELKKVEAELKKDEKLMKANSRITIRGITALTLFTLILVCGIGVYLFVANQSVYIEKSTIEAPKINLAANTLGTLENVYVKPGAVVGANMVTARVGNELIQTKVAGIITMADANLGQNYAAGQTVISMIDPTQLRVVGQIDENKGLDRISVGQYVVFTIDAFGSKKFTGIVDEVSPEAQSSDVVFQISDARQVQVFDVKVRFDINKYPELKNGMSAKMWVYTK